MGTTVGIIVIIGAACFVWWYVMTEDYIHWLETIIEDVKQECPEYVQRFDEGFDYNQPKEKR
jgi:hypothetical protein